MVVTAQKREQRLVDVPVTITALTGQKLAELGVNSLSEAALFVPGLRIQEQSDNNPGFVIRGVTSDSGSAQQGARSRSTTTASTSPARAERIRTSTMSSGSRW